MNSEKLRKRVHSSLRCGAILGGLLLAPALAGNTAIVPVAKDGRWMERHVKFLETAQQGGADVVFLGDSITERWEMEAPQGGRAIWNDRFVPMKAVEFGISGDRTQHVLWRIQNGEFDGFRPKVVVLMIGTNNTGLERDQPVPRNSVPEAIEGIRAVVKALTKKLPETKILLLAVFPRGETPDDPARRQVDEINAALPALHDGKQVYFLDLGRRFLRPDGTLSSGIMPDFLHPAEAGYRIWADAIEAPLKTLLAGGTLSAGFLGSPTDAVQTVKIDVQAAGPRFDGIGVVNGGGATSVLLKDYPEPQRSQILDLMFKPKFGASVSALMVEIPGDGNSTQGSMPSHMHARDDLNYQRGYMWWVLQEAKRRNPALSLDAAAWSAPGWVGEESATRFAGKGGDAAFWSQDAVDYYVKWLEGLRQKYGLELDAIGCRNEKGVSAEFAEHLRAALDANGFAQVKVHGFDNWPSDKLDFVPQMMTDEKLRAAIDVIGAHIFWEYTPVSQEVRQMAATMNKPIWNSEEHVYRKGFDCAISLVQAFNHNFIHSGATKIVMWYDIAALYPMEPYSADPAAILAHSPWSGHYEVREVLWGYAHYGQFSAAGWRYLPEACGQLAGGGTFVTLASPANDFSVIIETKGAKALQQVRLELAGVERGRKLCLWRSNAHAQFVRQPDVDPSSGSVTLTLDPDSIYSLSTTTGQQKGSFADVPAASAFPFPYADDFEGYEAPADYGCLPHYTADIADVFALVNRPDGPGKCLRQVVPIPTISWAPDWKPYTILGDDQWQDYEVSADVWLNPEDTAGVMGRVNHVGTGYGFIPKGYYLQLGADGECRLVVVRGKPDKKKLVGDAEQQALIKAAKDGAEGGEKVLATIRLPDFKPGAWHNLTLRFQGSKLTGLVDGMVAVSASDELYPRGMAGLIAGAGKKLSTPYFDNLAIKPPEAPPPAPSPALKRLPMYPPARTN